MLAVSILLALVAVVFGAVRPREIPALLDLRLLELLFVLILAAECARISRGLDSVVQRILSRVRSERSLSLSAILDPVRLFGATPAGFVLSGALVSQVVSNVPAAMLLASKAEAAGGGALFTALLYGVNPGGCGTPISPLANLVGADLYLRGRVGRRRFWGPFLAVSWLLLAAGILLSLFLVRPTP
jgi:Na+/H+ antiporter NhaD/arsenite permease-like protein